MQQTHLFFKSLGRIAMLGFLLLFGMPAFAVIPAVIVSSSNYTVTGTENSVGGVTLQPSSTLLITGSAANAIINGNITVASGAELQIYSGATVTFNGNITINPGGTLRIYPGAGFAFPIQTIKMAAGTKIVLKGNTSLVSGDAWAHIEYARFSCATPGGFWKGFETSVTGSGTYTHSTQINMNHSVIEKAVCAYRNYDSDNANISATAGGLMFSTENVYRNNIRHLAVYNQTGVSVPTNALNTFNYNDKVSNFFDCEFINDAGFTSSPAPADMVYLNNSSNIGFFNCKFRNWGNATAINACINAINSGFFLQGSTYQNALPPSRDTIRGFTNGVLVTNSLQTDRVCVITNTDFSCVKSINMSGCLNPYILNCRFEIPFYNFPPAQPPYNVVGAYLNNCTGYKIEGNYSFDHPGAGPFAVLHNSGTANNEIYRNKPVYSILGIQAVGINRDAAGSAGLKIFCNDVSGNATGISMIADPQVLPGIAQGVSNQQFTISGIFNITSAGNRFAQDPNRWDIYADPNLNTSSLIYRYRSASIAEQPVYHNLSGSVGATSHNNTCPVRNAGATPQPFPFSQFVAQNTAIEEKINVIKATAIDPSDEAVQLALVAPLYAQHAQNIDAISTYYQYMAARDTTGHHEDYQDSLELVYQTVTVGYEYKIYLASAYADKGAYDRAIKTLTELPEKYKLNDDEQQYMRNLQDLFTVRQWLYLNEGNWREIPGDLKEMVYANEKNDPMFAGAMARAILAQYEGATYDPYYVIPPMPVKQQTSKMIKGLSDSKIYPNPTTGYASITWEGDDAVLVLNNTNGQKVYQTNIKSGKSEIDLSHLASGTYIAQVIVNGKQVYQQHLVKK